MKTKHILLAICFLSISFSAEAQFLKKLKKKAEEAAKETVLRKVEEKTTEKTEKAMDTLLNADQKLKKKQNGVENDTSENENLNEDDNMVNDNLVSDEDYPENATENLKTDQESIVETPPIRPWSKYNFVPGDHIIFHDDLSKEENGEFPSRWDLIKGNVENASFDNENIINFENESIITPLMETDEYLPEVFTIEFDAFFDREIMKNYLYNQVFKLRFWDGNSHSRFPNNESTYHPLHIYRFGAFLNASIKGQERQFKSFEESMMGMEPVWRHIAIAFNKRSLKVFVDEYRALNIPNLGFMPKKVSIEGYTHPHGKESFTIAIKNIRIAEGGKKLYDRVLTDGKILTRGILFDINKSIIKPESSGVINEIAQMMQEHPDLKFRIEGHTDSDGTEEHNNQLSEQRANAVKQALMDLNIDAARMTVKGMGESVPVSDNNTPEGKANNRRVEFVKI
ncbi:OmpA family protein [Aestuariivivens insulae]|uniref:OmpA family protein n=1 Tax=Aestuariivivens insulae TaxID=1621988 RepID=UPI001F569696|nr:OmpA family protein [Aestuariivivens insulae]